MMGASASASTVKTSPPSAPRRSSQLSLGALKELFDLFDAFANFFTPILFVLGDDHARKLQSHIGELALSLKEIEKLDRFGTHLLREDLLHKRSLLFAFDLRRGWDLFVDKRASYSLLDAQELFKFMWRYEANSRPLLAGSTGSADSMHIAFGIEGDVVIKDMGNIADIETSCSNIGSDEDICCSAFEGFDGLFALALGHIAVEPFGIETLGAQKFGESIHLHLHPTKDDRLVGVFVVKKTHKRLVALPLIYHIEVLLDIFVGYFAFGDGDELGRVEDLACKLFDLVWHRCTKKECLAIGGKVGKDLFDIVQKAHIEHLVRFIKHHEAGIELHFAAF